MDTETTTPEATTPTPTTPEPSTPDIPQPPVIPDIPTLDPVSPEPSTPLPQTPSIPTPTDPEPQIQPAMPVIDAPKPAESTPPPQVENTQPIVPAQKHISFPTIILIVLLAVLAGVLLFLAINPAKKAPVTMKHVTPIAQPSQAHTILSLVANTGTEAAVSPKPLQKSVLVNVDASSNTIAEVQFEIAYDPTVLSNVSVSPGTFFTNPVTFLNQVDATNGKINFAIGIQPNTKGATGSGMVAIISYSILPSATVSATDLTFLPKTQVTQTGILTSVLEKTVNLSLPTGLIQKVPLANPLNATPTAALTK